MKSFFAPSLLKSGLPWAQQIIWPDFSQIVLFQLGWKSFYTLQCYSSDMDPKSQGQGLLKSSRGRFGKKHSPAYYTLYSSFGMYGFIFFHILGLEDCGCPIGILELMHDYLVSIFRSDSDPNKVPEELRGSGALQRAGLLPGARVPEGPGGGEQQAGRFASMDA